MPLEINIGLDEEKHTLTLTDTGIGMTRHELEANLGTIAHSGSNTFLAGLAEAAKKDVNLIGQFGVGFYSAFMAANRVLVQTRSWDGSEGSRVGLRRRRHLHHQPKCPVCTAAPGSLSN